jgi:hypothetical protein
VQKKATRTKKTNANSDNNELFLYDMTMKANGTTKGECSSYSGEVLLKHTLTAFAAFE